MGLASWAVKVGLGGALALAAGGWAQSGPVMVPATEALPATMEDALRAMEQQAAVIFAGQVIAVRPVAGASGAGVVEIDFSVDDAVRGAGGVYTLREWAGLWPAGEQRFRVGQRFLMLLHAPGAAGLSSPVGGMDGAISIRGGAETPLLTAARAAGVSAARPSVDATEASTADGDARTLDMRWVATQVARPVQYRASLPVHTTVITGLLRAEVASPARNLAGELAGTGAEVPAAGSAALQAPVGVVAGAAQDAGYATVLGLLRSWEKANAEAR